MKTNHLPPPGRSRAHLFIAAALLVGGLGAMPAALHAATYTVNALTDTAPTTGGAGSGNAGDLRYCVTQSNYGASGTVNTIAFAVTGAITLSGHELVIDNDLTINGPGAASLTLDGSNASRIFYVAPGMTAAISGLTMTHGNGVGNDPTGVDTSGNKGGAIFNDQSVLTTSSCTFTANSAGFYGGGIYNNGFDNNASLTVTACAFTGNSVQYAGGAIYNEQFQAFALLTATDSSFTGNSAGQGGGAINNYDLAGTNSATTPNAVIANCTISGNTAGNYSGGGGISNGGEEGGAGAMTITSCIILSNSASGDGGGVLNQGGGGFVSVVNCTVGNNIAADAGGGIANEGESVIVDDCAVIDNTTAASGAGILCESGSTAVNNTTICGNAAQLRGGGIYNEAAAYDSSAITIGNCTIAGNAAHSGAAGAGIANDGNADNGHATVTISNTILALNPTGANFNSSVGTNVSGGFNLCDDATGNAFLTGTGDLVSTPAGLQVTGSGTPLAQSNGGPTQTIALTATSAAVNAGLAAIDPLTGLPATADQRGYPRPYEYPGVPNAPGGDGSDIGAYELEGSFPLTLTATNGIVTPAPNQATYSEGSQVLLTASAAAGYMFTGWSGDASGSTNPLTITVTGATEITANFSVITYTLHLAAANGTVTPNPIQATYDAGSQVILTASAAGGYQFTGWTGDASGSANPLTITMTGDKNITANFSPIMYTLALSGARGTVKPDPDQQKYNFGSQVMITATPDAGYLFTGWSGDASGAANPLTITMDGNQTIAADFIPEPAGIFGGSFTDQPGAITLTLGRTGGFTGTLVLDGTAYRLAGAFNGTGGYTGSAIPPLPVTLQLIVTGSGSPPAILTGSAGGVELTADPAAYAKGETAAEAGKYTVILSATGAGAAVPQGAGYATLSVTKAGGVSITGKLADGESFAISGVLVGGSAGNQVIISKLLTYPSVTAKRAKGLLAGAFTFQELPGSDIDGTLEWAKPEQSKGDYPAAIATELNVTGSLYTFAKGGSVLPGFTSGTLRFSDPGALGISGTAQGVTLTAANTITASAPATDKLKMTIKTKTGLFSGAFLYPGEVKPTPFAGVLLQDGTDGAGFFLGPAGSGNVNLTSP